MKIWKIRTERRKGIHIAIDLALIALKIHRCKDCSYIALTIFNFSIIYQFNDKFGEFKNEDIPSDEELIDFFKHYLNFKGWYFDEEASKRDNSLVFFKDLNIISHTEEEIIHIMYNNYITHWLNNKEKEFNNLNQE